MGATLTQRRRVGEVTVPHEEAPANYVPAAAVIRRGRALFGITGRKAHAGGSLSLLSKAEAQPQFYNRYWRTRVCEREVEFPV